MLNLMEVDEGGRWNIVGNTYKWMLGHISVICETWPIIPVVNVNNVDFNLIDVVDGEKSATKYLDKN